MHGLMMDMPLLISDLIRHADRNHGDTEIVSRTVEGDIHRYTYRDAHARARRAANALRKLGVKAHERVATLAWNSFRHYELYYAISGMGAEGAPAVPALTAALRDQEAAVRYAVAIALREIGPPARAAIPALEKVAEDDINDDVAFMARKALKAIRGETAARQ